jgi:hypothetical protein
VRVERVERIGGRARGCRHQRGGGVPRLGRNGRACCAILECGCVGERHRGSVLECLGIIVRLRLRVGISLGLGFRV